MPVKYEKAVIVEGLVKEFGKVRALDGVSFTVEEGEIFGLIGPNGAGKTTTLRILATLLLPTRGTVTIFGYDVVKDAGRIREIISYLPEEAGAYRNLSGYEYLNIVARLYFQSKQEAEEAVEEAVRISGLGDRIHDKVKQYSKGMKRRLQIARVLMVKPKLAILDEPTAGLDVSHALYVRKLIREYTRKNGMTVILSSHNMLEVEHVCSRIALIHKGVIYEYGAPEELMEKYDAENLEEVFVKVVGYAV